MEELDRVNFLLHNPSEASHDDVSLLESEIDKYPYSQFLHVLMAKIKFQFDSKDKNVHLGKAAIFSSDRTSLKKVIMEVNFLETIEEVAPFQDLKDFDFEESEEEMLYEESENESATIFDEVLKNLEKLKSLRRQFQFLELNQPTTTAPEEKKSEKKKVVKKEKNKRSIASQNIKKDQNQAKKLASKKKKLDKILEKDELLDSQVNVFFLKEIEEKKEKQKKENSQKHLTQNDIIEKFIEEQPSIGAIKKEIENSQDEINKDLSEKSTKFGDDLVSENLAIILLKQGKKERAIDIYKKLIWKLPQKKAYFAARIEEIKK